MCYSNGEGVVQDETEACRCFRRAAQQGHAQSQHNLGLNYHDGVGVALDDAEAGRWLQRAAEQGLADARDSLARGRSAGLF